MIYLPSPAKLNLFLHIVGQRPDGYHNLETVFQFLDHCDTLGFSVNTTGNINLLTPIDGVKNEDNLIVKAARLLQQKAQTPLGADITLEKVLPMGGGLGGGSSNAATVLVGLNKLWDTKLSLEELAALGVSLGADVPIFVHGFSALARGVGEQLTPYEPDEYWYLVSKPACSISTVSVFTAKDLPRNTPQLELPESNATINIEKCHNDCQTFVTNHYPEVAKLLAWLLEYAPSRMTGTGACIFSRFTSEQEACQLQSQLPAGIESFVAKGMNQSPLIHALKSSV